MPLVLTSPAFTDGGAIPARHSCLGGDHSPALAWDGAPEGTAGFALLVEDPDAPDPAAPKLTWVHWVVYDLPATCNALSEDSARTGLPAGARAGTTSRGDTGFHGPCPPIGRHRYFHRLYALDGPLGDLDQPTADALRVAMQGRVLAEATLMGTFSK